MKQGSSSNLNESFHKKGAHIYIETVEKQERKNNIYHQVQTSHQPDFETDSTNTKERRRKESQISSSLESLLRDELRQHVSTNRSYSNMISSSSSRKKTNKKRLLKSDLRNDLKTFKRSSKRSSTGLCSQLKGLSLSCPMIPEEETLHLSR
mmetsp:Transcript_23164/g.35132  ORF Transcript_23164/g.35132 Transcript_23164/m.35132 type:complete len:151 (+) Transcript_23164:70-522(+)|eukprot:CAMPEP_0194199512 /NCGR_PEP_ID=MMETSP0156-20130528/505_1 /TAXON_ID=33649 /ORGANISM="Thalassionema nitzschioides, Strain L26-B" /LENGTH=150 /DNA_ID=CAMNT_0038924417 /DNA_START=59 /DNA_END=511 /DNA_ORIENTATION=-